MYRRSRPGFSLVELLIAIALFVSFFFLVMDVWPVNARATQQGKSLGIATHLAEQQMALAQAQTFTSVTAVSPPVSVRVASMVNGVAQSTTFTYSVTVNLVTADTKDVVVQVGWVEGGVSRNVMLETLLCSH